MDRRTKAALNRDKAVRLASEWGVEGVAQARYSEDGHWYATLNRFPAALFDAHGYIVFETEAAYRNSPMSIGRQISVRKPGISGIPGYFLVFDSMSLPGQDVDIHTFSASEGRQRLVMHLQRERSPALVRKKKQHAASLSCEVCGFSFSDVYGTAAINYCEVHHLIPLSKLEDTKQTRMEDLAILCANCHRVVHLRDPPLDLDELRRKMAK